MRTDYIPTGDEAFLDWAQNFLTYTASHAAAWGIAENKVAALQALKDTYAEKLAAAKAPNRGKADVLAKNEARHELEAALRPFVKSHITYNEDITDEDRVKMGTPVHKNKPSPVPPPSTHPDFDIDTGELRQLTIHFRDEGSTHRGKPTGVHGAEICWDFLNAPPEKIEELKRSEFDTASPHTLHFEEGERGKRVYICLRWENNKGQKGPWGEVVDRKSVV
jgi:hypothetical protein